MRTRLKNKSPRNDPPFPIYRWENNQRYFDRSRTVFELWDKWGEGYYNFYWIGGGEVKYYIKRTWIEKVV